MSIHFLQGLLVSFGSSKFVKEAFNLDIDYKRSGFISDVMEIHNTWGLNRSFALKLICVQLILG